MSLVLKMLAKDDECLLAPSNPFVDENAMELNEITQKLCHYFYFSIDDSCSIATIKQSFLS